MHMNTQLKETRTVNATITMHTYIHTIVTAECTTDLREYRSKQKSHGL